VNQRLPLTIKADGVKKLTLVKTLTSRSPTNKASSKRGSSTKKASRSNSPTKQSKSRSSSPTKSNKSSLSRTFTARSKANDSPYNLCLSAKSKMSTMRTRGAKKIREESSSLETDREANSQAEDAMSGTLLKANGSLGIYTTDTENRALLGQGLMNTQSAQTFMSDHLSRHPSIQNLASTKMKEFDLQNLINSEDFLEKIIMIQRAFKTFVFRKNRKLKRKNEAQ
jgi:hypothetical protein